MRLFTNIPRGRAPLWRKLGTGHRAALQGPRQPAPLPPRCISQPTTDPPRRGPGRPRKSAAAAATAAAPPAPRLPTHNPWAPAGAGGGRGGSRGGRQQQQGHGGGGQAVQPRPTLRQLIVQCRSAAELHELLTAHVEAVGPTDVAYAWHVAASRGFFGDAAGGCGEGSSAGAAPKGDRDGAGTGGGSTELHSMLTELAWRHLSKMGPVALSTTAWAAATSQLACEALLEAIGEHAEQQLYNFRPRELCALLWACALGAPSSLRLLKACSRYLEQGMTLELFSPHDLSVLVWCCGKIDYSPPGLIAAASAECLAQIASFDAPSAARLAHGYALLNHRPPRLLAPLVAHCEAVVGTFDAHSLSLLVSSLGKLLCDPGPNFAVAAAKAAGRLAPSARPAHLANLLWGFARLGHLPKGGAFLSRLSSHLERHVEEYGGELLASLLWAASKLRWAPSGAALDRALAYFNRELQQQSPGTLATAVWAFGVMAACNPRVENGQGQQMRAFAAAAAEHLGLVGGKLSAQDMPSVLIALATLQVHPSPAFAKRLAEGCADVADSLPADSLARLAWAAATLRLRHPRLLAAIAQAPSVGHLLPSAAAQLAWSLATLNYNPPDLLPALARAIAEGPRTTVKLSGRVGFQVDPLHPLDRARLLWAFARLGVYHQGLTDRMLEGLRPSEARKMGPGGVTSALWACARLRHHPGPVLAVLAGYAAANLPSFSRSQLLQLGWALRQLGCADGELLAAIEASLGEAQGHNWAGRRAPTPLVPPPGLAPMAAEGL